MSTGDLKFLNIEQVCISQKGGVNEIKMVCDPYITVEEDKNTN